MSQLDRHLEPPDVDEDEIWVTFCPHDEVCETEEQCDYLQAEDEAMEREDERRKERDL